MKTCSVCKRNEKVFSCDQCRQLLCVDCGALSASEVKCLELKNRVLLFYCKVCLSQGIAVNLEAVLKSKMEEAIGDLNSAFESFKAGFVKMASQKLSSLATASRSPVPSTEKTYAGIVARTSHQSVIVRPKDGNQGTSKTKLDLVAGVDPVGSQIKINNVKHVRDGGLVVGCSGAGDANKFVQLANEKLSSGYDVHLLRRVLPRIRITGISDKLTTDTLKEYILNQNEDLFCGSKDCKILKFKNTRNNEHVYQATLQLDTMSYDRILKAGYLIIGFDVCKVYDAVELTRCYKCNGFNHTSKSCKRDVSCPRCGADHDVKACTVADAKLCCINCSRANEKSNKSFETDHAVWDSQACAVYKQLVGRLKSDLFGTQ